MSTARDLISRSLRLIQVLDPGEVPTASEAQDSLEALNDMLDAMSIPGLYIYTLREDSVTWPSGQASRTIGPTGDFVLPRPSRLEDGCYSTSGGIDHPIAILRTRSDYSRIADKTTQSTIPEYLYYEPTGTDGTLYIWTVPSENVTIKLITQRQLPSFSTLDSTFTYPTGYREFMITSLCKRLAPEFGVAVPPEIMELAKTASRNVKRMNSKHVKSVIEPVFHNRAYDVNSDT